MPTPEQVIVVSGYKQRVSYYGLPAMPAWVFAAAPIVALIVGLLVG